MSTPVCIHCLGAADVRSAQPLLPPVVEYRVESARVELRDFLIPPQIIHPQIRLAVERIADPQLVYFDSCDWDVCLGLKSIGPLHLGCSAVDIVDVHLAGFAARQEFPFFEES